MIGLYHFCMEYYKNKMVYLNIILIIKHRFYEKTRKQLRQKMQEFRIGVLRVEDVDEANGKIILTVSEADAAMYQQKKMHQGSTAF